MLTTAQAVAEARHAMIDGNLVRAPVPARVAGQWLDVIEDTLKPNASPRVDVWCDGWHKDQNPPGLQMGYTFRPVINGAVLNTYRSSMPDCTEQPSMIAEYTAIIYALRWVVKHEFCGNVTIHTDCQTAWGQLTQGWQVRAYKYPQLGQRYSCARQLLMETGARLVKEPRLLVKAFLGH